MEVEGGSAKIRRFPTAVDSCTDKLRDPFSRCRLVFALFGKVVSFPAEEESKILSRPPGWWRITGWGWDLSAEFSHNGVGSSVDLEISPL